ncbi:hypothetical protein LY78DRAFT_440834 [Colletotrichum sublineola]|nr:hypothetical protein LY78DRAFT_440834 [Colletotrichum sublineola]
MINTQRGCREGGADWVVAREGTRQCAARKGRKVRSACCVDVAHPSFSLTLTLAPHSHSHSHKLAFSLPLPLPPPPSPRSSHVPRLPSPSTPHVSDFCSTPARMCGGTRKGNTLGLGPWLLVRHEKP